MDSRFWIPGFLVLRIYIKNCLVVGFLNDPSSAFPLKCKSVYEFHHSRSIYLSDNLVFSLSVDEKTLEELITTTMEKFVVPKGYYDLWKRHQKMLARFRNVPFVSPYEDPWDFKDSLEIKFEKHVVAGGLKRTSKIYWREKNDPWHTCTF